MSAAVSAWAAGWAISSSIRRYESYHPKREECREKMGTNYVKWEYNYSTKEEVCMVLSPFEREGSNILIFIMPFITTILIYIFIKAQLNKSKNN